MHAQPSSQKAAPTPTYGVPGFTSDPYAFDSSAFGIAGDTAGDTLPPGSQPLAAPVPHQLHSPPPRGPHQRGFGAASPAAPAFGTPSPPQPRENPAPAPWGAAPTNVWGISTADNDDAAFFDTLGSEPAAQQQEPPAFQRSAAAPDTSPVPQEPQAEAHAPLPSHRAPAAAPSVLSPDQLVVGVDTSQPDRRSSGAGQAARESAATQESAATHTQMGAQGGVWRPAPEAAASVVSPDQLVVGVDAAPVHGARPSAPTHGPPEQQSVPAAAPSVLDPSALAIGFADASTHQPTDASTSVLDAGGAAAGPAAAKPDAQSAVVPGGLFGGFEAEDRGGDDAEGSGIGAFEEAAGSGGSAVGAAGGMSWWEQHVPADASAAEEDRWWEQTSTPVAQAPPQRAAEDQGRAAPPEAEAVPAAPPTSGWYASHSATESRSLSWRGSPAGKQRASCSVDVPTTWAAAPQPGGPREPLADADPSSNAGDDAAPRTGHWPPPVWQEVMNGASPLPAELPTSPRQPAASTPAGPDAPTSTYEARRPAASAATPPTVDQRAPSPGAVHGGAGTSDALESSQAVFLDGGTPHRDAGGELPIPTPGTSARELYSRHSAAAQAELEPRPSAAGRDRRSTEAREEDSRAGRASRGSAAGGGVVGLSKRTQQFLDRLGSRGAAAKQRLAATAQDVTRRVSVNQDARASGRAAESRNGDGGEAEAAQAAAGRVEALERDLEHLRGELESWRGYAQSMEAAEAAARGHVGQLQNEVASWRNEAERAEQLRRDLDGLHVEAEAARRARDGAAAEAAELRAQLAAALDEVSQARAEAAAAGEARDVLEGRVAQLEADVRGAEALREELQAAQAQAAAAGARESDGVRSRLQKAERALEAERQERERLEGQYKKLTSGQRGGPAYAQLEAHVGQLEGVLSERDREIAGLRAQIASLEEVVSDARGHAARMEAAAHHETRLHEEVTARCSLLEEELDALRRGGPPGALEDLEREVQGARKALAEARAAAAVEKSRLESALEGKDAELRAAREEHARELEGARGDAERARAEAAQLEARCAELAAAADTARAASESLNARVATALGPVVAAASEGCDDDGYGMMDMLEGSWADAAASAELRDVTDAIAALPRSLKRAVLAESLAGQELARVAAELHRAKAREAASGLVDEELQRLRDENVQLSSKAAMADPGAGAALRTRVGELEEELERARGELERVRAAEADKVWRGESGGGVEESAAVREAREEAEYAWSILERCKAENYSLMERLRRAHERAEVAQGAASAPPTPLQGVPLSPAPAGSEEAVNGGHEDDRAAYQAEAERAREEEETSGGGWSIWSYIAGTA
ncbi:unnamed protein product [Pedinophyceae sp. YPF-701]|nr:unnamed protein product [Pedinophyceae sp. YPF-701]